MEIIWTDPAVQAAAIQSIGSVLAATVAAIGAVLVGKRFIAQRYLQERLVLAQEDIAFLLAVESEHCKRHAQAGSSLKKTMRDAARAEGLEWSGKFTPSRAKARVARLGIAPN